MLKIFSLKKKTVLFCAMVEYTYSYQSDLLNVKISMKKISTLFLTIKTLLTSGCTWRKQLMQFSRWNFSVAAETSEDKKKLFNIWLGPRKPYQNWSGLCSDSPGNIHHINTPQIPFSRSASPQAHIPSQQASFWPASFISWSAFQTSVHTLPHLHIGSFTQKYCTTPFC